MRDEGGRGWSVSAATDSARRDEIVPSASLGKGREGAAAETAPIVTVANLSYSYPNGQPALTDVSLRLLPGERVGLIGPNGAGKTTLLLHLNGLLPGPQADGAPSAVTVAGLPVVKPHWHEVRRRVGILFQDPDDQLFCPTVQEDVAFGPLNLGLTAAEVHARVRDSLAAVGLVGAEERSPHQMSFGERKRVCLAGVLACRPEVLALDEPTSNLDPRARRAFLEILHRCAAAQLIATHDLELVAELCTRVIILDGGRIHADGPAREILTNELLLVRHGLEVPLSVRYGR